jgi:RNA polymerase sigma-70 factor (ECF subfamily)
LTDAELVAGARHGQADSWEAIVQQHQEAVFRLAYLLLGDAAEAEDTAQDAFLRAYAALGRFDPDRPLRPWLLRITANLARNRLRSVGRYLAALQRAWRLDPAAARAAPEPSAEQAGLARLEAEAVWQAVRRLTPADQEIIYLRFFLELPEAEMAAALEVAAGTVKSRLHRASRRLRHVIETEFPDLGEKFKA